MIDLVLASRNPKKKGELQQILGALAPKIRLRTLDEFSNIPETEENEPTFEGNAAKKAREAALATQHWALGDDSGLEVDALGGRPGVYSARYAGEPRDQTRNNAKLLEELRGVPQEKRNARFICSLALADPQGQIRLALRGACEGRILEAPRGERGFGYDPLFLYAPLGRSFAELSAEEKHRVSHRGNALREFANRLEQLLKSLATNSLGPRLGS